MPRGANRWDEAWLQRIERSPAELFAGRKGYFFDFSDMSRMRQGSTSSSTAAAIGSTVGYAIDKSGNSITVTQGTAGNRPLLQEEGGVRYLDFDGTSDRMVSGTYVTAPPMTLIGAWRISSGAASRTFMDGINSSNRGCHLFYNSTGTVTQVYAGTSVISTSFGAPTADSVDVAVFNGANSMFSRNGSLPTKLSATPGSQNLDGLSLGSNASGGSLMFGRIYGVFVIQGFLRAEETAAVVRFFNRLVGRDRTPLRVGY